MAHATYEKPNVEQPVPFMDFDALMDSQEAQAAVQADTANAPVPAEKHKQKRAGGRPRKPNTAPVRKSKKKVVEDAPKKVVGIYYTDDEHVKLKIAAMRTGCTLTDYVASVSTDAMYYSYQCCEAACNAEFVLRSGSDGEPVAATRCPICGSSQIMPIKVL